MSWKLIALCVAVSAAASPASAQRYLDTQPRYEQGRRTTPEGTLYLGGYSRDTEGGQVVVDFYTRQDRALTNDGIRFGAIPYARRRTDTGQGEPRVIGWADGRRCGQLQGVLLEYTRLATPTLQTPSLYSAPANGSRAIDGPAPRIHPVDSSVWGYARQADGGQAVLTITGSDGLIDRWTAFAEEQLSGCWEDGSPYF